MIYLVIEIQQLNCRLFCPQACNRLIENICILSKQLKFSLKTAVIDVQTKHFGAIEIRITINSVQRSRLLGKFQVRVLCCAFSKSCDGSFSGRKYRR